MVKQPYVMPMSNGGSLDPETLAGLLQGDEFITIDETVEGDKVGITLDANYKPWFIELTGSSGTLTDLQFAKLTISTKAEIICDDEIYHKADIADGFIVFTHHGRDNQQQIYSKAIYVYTDEEAPVNYKHWTKVSTKVWPIELGDIDSGSGNLGKFAKAGSSGSMWSWITASDVNAAAAQVGQFLRVTTNGQGQNVAAWQTVPDWDGEVE